MSEQKIQRKILGYLKSLPQTWGVKVIAANRRGCPDIICCHKGWFVGLEVKSETGKPSPIQVTQLRNINDTGGITAIVRSVEHVEKLLSCVQYRGCKYRDVHPLPESAMCDIRDRYPGVRVDTQVREASDPRSDDMGQQASK